MTPSGRAPRKARAPWGTLGLALLMLPLLPAAPPIRAEQPPLRVAVSVPPLAEPVERIGGERVELVVMVPAGFSPETYEPSPRRLVALATARAYLRVGHPALAFERTHLERIAAQSPELVVIDLLAVAREIGLPGAGGDDPHLWMAPPAMTGAAQRLAAALAAIDPGRAGEYQRRLAAFLTDVEAAEARIGAALAGFAGRSFVVFHPAWGHFARRYGLEQVAIEHEGKEPGPARLVALVEEARRRRLKTLFVQPGFPRPGAAAIARQVGARLVTLDPLARDWLANLERTAAALRAALEEEGARPAAYSGTTPP